MGSTTSSSRVDVSISLENVKDEYEWIRAGSKVSGTAYLQVKEAVPMKGFALVLEGEEYSCVTYTAGDGSETVESNRNILRMTIPICEVSPCGLLGVGCYIIPFVFTLPSQLPSSMHVSSVHGNCGIKYYIKVETEGVADKKTHPFLVASLPLEIDPLPFLSSPEMIKVVAFTCCTRGSMAVAANVMMTQIAVGSEIPLQFACYNQSSTEIVGIYADLIEKVSWHAKGHSAKNSRVLNRKNLIKFISNIDGLKNVQNQANSQKRIYEKLYADVTDDKKIAKIATTLGANDTYSGENLSCSHSLVITVKTPGGMSSPTICIPLRIGRGEKLSRYEPIETKATAHHKSLTSFPVGWTSPITIAVPDSCTTIGGYAADHPGPSFSNKTFEQLLSGMKESLDEPDFIASCKDQEWVNILSSITPMQFGYLIKTVNLDHNQSKVALVLAESIKPFTCNHLIAALRTCKEWNRPNMVKKLVAVCEDLNTGADKIKAELTSWELTLTGKDFSDALERKR